MQFLSLSVQALLALTGHTNRAQNCFVTRLDGAHSLPCLEVAGVRREPINLWLSVRLFNDDTQRLFRRERPA